MSIGEDIAEFKKLFPTGLVVVPPMEYKPMRLDANATALEFRKYDVSALIEKLIAEIKKDDELFLNLKKAMSRT